MDLVAIVMMEGQCKTEGAEMAQITIVVLEEAMLRAVALVATTTMTFHLTQAVMTAATMMVDKVSTTGEQTVVATAEIERTTEQLGRTTN